jgi:hypothetical protein
MAGASRVCRRALAVCLSIACLTSFDARAQSTPATPLTPPSGITAQPLAPPPGATGQPLIAPPPAPVPGQPADTPSGTAQPGSGPPGSVQPTAPATRAAPATPPDNTAPSGYTPAPPVPQMWQPQGTALLQVLDKVNAQTTTLTVKVGQSGQAGTLTIAVRACDASAPNEKQDATAFLDITDSHPDAPGFHGWILKSDPSVSMLQHPIFDVRVLGCRP